MSGKNILMKTLAIVFGLLLCFASCGCSSNTPTSTESNASAKSPSDDAAVNPNDNTLQNSYQEISQEEAQEIIKGESNFIILDVRRDDEFSEGHIPNAINIPVEAIEEMTLDEKIAELPDKQQLIMVYCRTGRRSKIAAQKLAEMGYSNIVEFGGITTWTGDITTS